MPSQYHRLGASPSQLLALLPLLMLLMLLMLPWWIQAAESLVVFDGEITISGRGPSFPAEANLPANWTAPVDYTTGILYIEWEILEAPEDAAELLLQIGWHLPAQEQRHLVRYRYMQQIGKDFSAPYFVAGTSYTTAHRMQNDRCFWPLRAKDYSGGISGLTGMVRNRSWQVTAPSGPVRIALVMTLVPEGATYQAPHRYNGIGPRELPDLPQVAQALRDRQPGLALALAESLAERHDATSAQGTQARQAQTALRQWGEEAAARAKTLFASDPVAGAERMVALGDDFSRSSLGEDFKARVDRLRQDPRLRAEIPAHRLLLEMEQAASALRAAADTSDFSDPAVQRRHQQHLQPLAQRYRSLRQRHSATVSYHKARALLMSLGIEPN